MKKNVTKKSKQNLMTDMFSDLAITVFSKITTSRELAKFLDVKYSSLIYSLRLANRKTAYPRYTNFQIPKKNGSFRNISAPNKTLLYAQTNLNLILSQIYKPPKAAHGFIKYFNQQNDSTIARSIISNANNHKRKAIVLNIDLKDFFPSINSKRVFSLFTKQPFNFNKQVAGLLAEICTHDVTKNLPQGAPTSPIISNMICRGLDKKLTVLSNTTRVTYTRYADDLTFSSTKDNLNDEFISKVSEIIINEGFEINNKKLRKQTRSMRQEVTGLIVNEKVNVERKYVRRIRAMLHNWEVKGIEQCQKEMEQKYNKRGIKKSIPDFDLVLKGMIEFLGQVRGKDEGENRPNLYKKFIKSFYQLKYPGNIEEYNKNLIKHSIITEYSVKDNSEKPSEDYNLNDIIPFIE